MTRRMWIIGVVSLAAGLIAFLSTVWAAPAATSAASARPLCRWLALSGVQQGEISQDDPTFDTDVATLREAARSSRVTLATMMESPNTPDAEILTQVDRVAAAEHQLQRRVVEYVLRIRHHLSADQQRQLMGLCAGGMRGNGPGRGAGGMGRGPGPHGPGFGGGRGGDRTGN